MNSRLNIVIAGTQTIPAFAYGSTERIMWSLGKALTDIGHRVTFLTGKGSACPFANVRFLDKRKPLQPQLPADTDVVHFHFQPTEPIGLPYVATVHWNVNDFREFDINTIFVSRSHARRYGSEAFVYNGLDWSMYGTPPLDNPRTYFHFLGNADWPLKNVEGAIRVVENTGTEFLSVLGGWRLRMKYGIRFHRSRRTRFYGMVGGAKKNKLLQNSKGLIFPVVWPEPFGLAITESLYFGCPVFGTLHGALPELITDETGFLSNDAWELSERIRAADQYNRHLCHAYARDVFNAEVMTREYLKKYECVLGGKHINVAPPRLVHQQKTPLLEWIVDKERMHDGRQPAIPNS